LRSLNPYGSIINYEVLGYELAAEYFRNGELEKSMGHFRLLDEKCFKWGAVAKSQHFYQKQ
jgi:hypothetical protein